VTPDGGSTYTVPVIVEQLKDGAATVSQDSPRKKRIQTSLRFRKKRQMKKNRKNMTMKQMGKRISTRNPRRSITVL
jgi:hypothetical protein